MQIKKISKGYYPKEYFLMTIYNKLKDNFTNIIDKKVEIVNNDIKMIFGKKLKN